MKFARWVFGGAGIYGLAVLFPFYFMVERISREQPPALTHLEYYYGFVGLGLVFQIVFLIIARDPVRYRALMIPAILEKVSFAIPVALLYRQHAVYPGPALGALIDAFLAVLFTIAYLTI